MPTTDDTYLALTKIATLNSSGQLRGGALSSTEAYEAIEALVGLLLAVVQWADDQADGGHDALSSARTAAETMFRELQS